MKAIEWQGPTTASSSVLERESQCLPSFRVALQRLVCVEQMALSNRVTTFYFSPSLRTEATTHLDDEWTTRTTDEGTDD